MIDTSKMPEGKRAAFEIVENARENDWKNGSFVRDLFLGKFSSQRMFPWPVQSIGDIEKEKLFLDKLQRLLREKVDAEAIDKTGTIPGEVIDDLKAMGAFGIKIPVEYGGLGLSQMTYQKAFVLLGSHCSNLATILSVHQSVGVPQPLLLFGTAEQKKKYLPRIAAGALSAFALTEEKVGSDPARMETTAIKESDGQTYLINGRKLWCSNGPIAELMVVAAKTGNSITTFIVDTKLPGISVAHQCHFMGLKALSNGVIEFKNVRVRAEDILLGEGKGLKVALTTLNTGRLAIAASALGLAKQCLHVAREWSTKRVQWGVSIAQHETIQEKLAEMSTLVYSMEAILEYTGMMVDLKASDIRLEAAMCKMWCTESAWKIVNHAVQILGGRGYETAESLRGRGETPYPLERFLRDSRISTIFEGSSEILRLFIARESLDHHFKQAGPLLEANTGWFKMLFKAITIMPGYCKWLAGLYFRSSHLPEIKNELHPDLLTLERDIRHLARQYFRLMLTHRESLEKRQSLLNRIVDIGAECFAQSTVIAKANRKESTTPIVDLARQFCVQSRLRIKFCRTFLADEKKIKFSNTVENLCAGQLDELFENINSVVQKNNRTKE